MYDSSAHFGLGLRTISMIRVVSWRSNSSVAFPWMSSAAFGWWSMVTMTIGSAVFQCVAALMMTLGLDRCSITPWIQLLHKTIRSSHLMLILIKIVSGINSWTMPATLCSTTSLATLLACRSARTKKMNVFRGDSKISWIKYIVYDFWESFPRSWGPTCWCLQVGFLVYTGAADFDETLPHLDAACAYFAEVQPEVL